MSRYAGTHDPAKVVVESRFSDAAKGAAKALTELIERHGIVGATRLIEELLRDERATEGQS